MHDAGNALKSRFLLLADVAVAFEDDDVAFSAYDSVDEDVASQVADHCDCASADVAVCPWTEGYLVAQMCKEWVHAVAFDGDGYGVAFSNESADFLIHRVFVNSNLFGVFHIPGSTVQKYG